MIIKIQLWEPIISTIPDDTMLFAILDPSRALSSKIIAENYINFYALRHPYVGDVIFRFENLIDYESIHGLTRLFIPKEYMLPFVENMGFFADLLKKGYAINMPVSKQAIDFYSTNCNVHHHMLIYGVDLHNQEFLCKDYYNHKFVEFKTPYFSLVSSTQRYNNPSSTESDGILAYKLDNEIDSKINYSKVHLELTKLYSSLQIGDIDAYGLSAILYFLKDMENQPLNTRFGVRWYETANYLRESAKLMKKRFYIIADDLALEPNIEQKEKISNLLSTASSLFFCVYKAVLADKFDGHHKVIFSDLCLKCYDAWKEFTYAFLKIIE